MVQDLNSTRPTTSLLTRGFRSLFFRKSFRKFDTPEQRELAAKIRSKALPIDTPLPAAPITAVPVHLETLIALAPTPEREKKIIGGFFAQITPLLEHMQYSCRNDEVEQWKRVAHSVHDAAAELGMPALEELCKKAANEPPASYSARLRMFQLIKAETQRIELFMQARHQG